MGTIQRERRRIMKTKEKVIILAALIVGFMVLGAALVVAQDKPADTMRIYLEKLRADKKLFVAQNMGLTKSEAEAFWPVYENYQNDLGKLFDRSVKVVHSFDNGLNTISDEAAKKLLDECLAIEGKRQKLRESYVPKFRSALPDRKVVLYYQMENKIEAALKFELAKSIPFLQ
jgi:hypothetical protein